MLTHVIPAAKSVILVNYINGLWVDRGAMASARDEREPVTQNPQATDGEHLLDIDGLLEIAEIIRRIKDEGRLTGVSEKHNSQVDRQRARHQKGQ